MKTKIFTLDSGVDCESTKVVKRVCQQSRKKNGASRKAGKRANKHKKENKKTPTNGQELSGDDDD